MTHFLDITTVMEDKITSFEAHKSQFPEEDGSMKWVSSSVHLVLCRGEAIRRPTSPRRGSCYGRRDSVCRGVSFLFVTLVFELRLHIMFD